MAEHLANIYGSEKDKVNCSFYFKIGACRHGEKCSRKHVKPNFSQTLVMPNVYKNPGHLPDNKLTEEELQKDFDDFFEDMFVELAKYGRIEEMTVCDNIGDHLVGNVYARYYFEEDAGKAVEDLNKRFYAGWPLYAELSPVTDFGEACCRQYEMSECNRGGFCNFMHVRKPSKALFKELFAAQKLSIKLLKPKEDEEENSDEDKGADSDHDRDREKDRERRSSRRKSRSRSRDRKRSRREHERH